MLHLRLSSGRQLDAGRRYSHGLRSSRCRDAMMVSLEAISRFSKCCANIKGVPTLGSGEVPFGFPGIGMFLIVDRTSVPDSIERFRTRTTNATPARSTKTRRLPRSKPTMLKPMDRIQLYTMNLELRFLQPLSRYRGQMA